MKRALRAPRASGGLPVQGGLWGMVREVLWVQPDRLGLEASKVQLDKGVSKGTAQRVMPVLGAPRVPRVREVLRGIRVLKALPCTVHPARLVFPARRLIRLHDGRIASDVARAGHAL